MAKKKTETAADDHNKTIKDRILVARKNSRDWHNKVKQWNKYWNGTSKPASIRPNDYISVNYVFAIIKNKLARLYYRNPYIDVQARNPQDPEMVQSAKKAEAVVNKQMGDRHLGIRGQVKKSLTDWQRVGLGCFFVGWSTMLDEEDGDVKSIIEDEPDFRRVHPLKVHLPPSFTPEHLPYLVVEVDSSLEDLKKNKNYDQTVIKNLRPASLTYVKPDGKESGVSETKDLARVKTFHYYDEEEMAVYVQSEDEPILAPTTNPYTEVFGRKRAIPYRFIWADDDLETEWPIGTTQVMEKLQLELNKTRSQKSIHRKRFNRKYLADKTLTNEDISKLEEGQDGTIVPVNIEGGKNIGNLVWPVPDAQQSIANDEVDKLIKDDINVVTGSSQLTLQGRSVNPTLGQDSIAETKSQSREDEEQEMVEEFVEEIYASLLQLDQKKLQTPIVVKIAGAEAPTAPVGRSIPGQPPVPGQPQPNPQEAVQKQKWQELSSEDIQGELSLKVVSGSMVRETSETIRKEAMQLIPVLQGAPWLSRLIPEIVVSVLDTYPIFSGVAEKAKAMVAEMETNPVPPMPQHVERLLAGMAQMAQSGIPISFEQVQVLFQMVGLPAAQAPQPPGQPGTPAPGQQSPFPQVQGLTPLPNEQGQLPNEPTPQGGMIQPPAPPPTHTGK